MDETNSGESIERLDESGKTELVQSEFYESQSENFDGEGSYICENCGEEIVIPLDPIEGSSQSYVEDCPVCCTPMVIHVNFDGAHAIVWAESEQDRY